MTTVSVLIPLFDTPPGLLHQALLSVERQRFDTDRIQVCVHDDGSASEYRTGYETLDLDAYDVEIAWSEASDNRGISCARNAAARTADGEIYLLLDADDVLHPDAIRLVVEQFDRHDRADLVYSDNVKFTWPDVDLYQFRRKHCYQTWLTEYGGTTFDPLIQASFVVGIVAFRAETFAKIGGYDERLQVGEDIDFLTRIHGRSAENTFVHVPRVLYYRRHDEESLSRRRGDEMVENTEAILLRAARSFGLDVTDVRYVSRLQPYGVSHYFLFDEEEEAIVPPYVQPTARRLEGVADTEASLHTRWERVLKPQLLDVVGEPRLQSNGRQNRTRRQVSQPGN